MVMDNMFTLTKQLSDARHTAAQLFNLTITNGESGEKFENCLVNINSLKAKIAALKDAS